MSSFSVREANFVSDEEKCVGVNLVVSAAHLADLGKHSGILTVVFLGSCIIMYLCPR